jgi:tetratricopeptide (TPR) repeat protein
LDFFTSTESRLICAALTAIVFLLVLANPRARRFRAVILGLVIAVGLANAFLLIHKRLVHSNLTHYYLGAKYGVPYFDFYKVTTAAMGKPQLMYRDLREPDRMFRSDPREQRLYYIGLLRQVGISFPDSATLDQLAETCHSRGLLGKEAAAILKQELTPGRVTALRNDLARLKLDVDDFGFNGSPLYTLIRQVDPSLHRLFGPAVCLINLAWQWAALFFMAFLAGRIFQWTREDALLVVALLLASWDYTGWALNGLTTAGWMLPVMLALWGFRRRSPMLAGFGIAWAGLIKLFPFVLVLPIVVILARQMLSRQLTATGKEAAKTLVACVVSTVALAVISSLTGRPWTEFFEKISIQFQDSSFLNNSVGVSNIFLTLGLGKSLSIILPQATVFFAILWILWMRKDEDLRERLPALALVLLASMAWLTRTWFNYYAIIGFFLVPGLLQRNRRAAVFLLALFALGGFLPDFGFAYREPFTFLPIVKILGYLILPVAAIAMEINDIKQVPNSAPGRDRLSQWFFGREQLILSAGAALSVVFICAEIYGANSARTNLSAGRELYRKGAVSEARLFFETAVKHAPRDAAARIELAQAMADLQDFEGALAQYRKAVELNPTYAPARSRLGVLLAQGGRQEEALAQFTEAAKLMPYDETIQFNLGSALLSIGQKDEASAHCRTALDINPDFPPARKQLESISSLRQ